MKKLGQYQNEITDLAELDIWNYERIFKIHEKTNSGKRFYFYNILRKIELPENIQSDLTLHHYVKARTPLTTVSYNIYGDIESWWIIYLLNKKSIPDLFWVDGGTQLKYLTDTGLALIYNEITRQIHFYGRHY